MLVAAVPWRGNRWGSALVATATAAAAAAVPVGVRVAYGYASVIVAVVVGCIRSGFGAACHRSVGKIVIMTGSQSEITVSNTRVKWTCEGTMFSENPY